MSKLAKKPIDVANIECNLTKDKLTFKGKHGDLSIDIPSSVTISIEENALTVASESERNLGLYFSLIKNMAVGVNQQFTEELILNGVGYRVALSNNKLNFNLGYSHPAEYVLPDNVKAEIISPTEIKLVGVDKQLVGQVAAEIIQLRPAKKDPYKLKGVRRKRDRIIKKAGKKVK
jgi:large subunit ribosomal protein L6